MVGSSGDRCQAKVSIKWQAMGCHGSKGLGGEPVYATLQRLRCKFQCMCCCWSDAARPPPMQCFDDLLQGVAFGLARSADEAVVGATVKFRANLRDVILLVRIGLSGTLGRKFLLRSKPKVCKIKF